jgi:WD40 repeat protein
MILGGASGGVILWDRQRQTIDRIALPESGVKVNCCDWSPDGKYLVWCVGSNPLTVWDCEKSEERARLGDARMVVQGSVHSWTTFKGHKGGANACAWSPDGRYIASGSGHGFGSYDDDFSVRIWDCGSFQEIATLQGHRDRVTHISWSDDCRPSAGRIGPPSKQRLERPILYGSLLRRRNFCL